MSSFQPTGQNWHTGSTRGPRARFGQRFLADAADLFVQIILWVLMYAIFHIAGELVAFLIATAYFTLLEGGRRGQTVGKMWVGIRVASIDDGMPIGYGRAFIRTLARILSAIPFDLGYLWMLWSPERQTWHDMLGRAVVIPTATEPEPPR